jgi:hypothetical protein
MIVEKCFSMSIYGFQNLFLILHIIICYHGKCLNTRDPGPDLSRNFQSRSRPVPTWVEISNPDPVLEHCTRWPKNGFSNNSYFHAFQPGMSLKKMRIQVVSNFYDSRVILVKIIKRMPTVFYIMI